MGVGPGACVPHQVQTADNQFNASSIHIQSLECARPGSVWVLFTGQESGTERTPYVAYHGTADGAWTAVLKARGGPPSVAAPEAGTHPGALAVVDRARVVYSAITPSSTPSVAVATASEGGRALGPWQPVPSLFSVTSVSFPGPTTGWLVGPKAGAPNVDAVVMTNDGGRTWHEQLTRQVDPPGEP